MILFLSFDTPVVSPCLRFYQAAAATAATATIIYYYLASCLT